MRDHAGNSTTIAERTRRRSSARALLCSLVFTNFDLQSSMRMRFVGTTNRAKTEFADERASDRVDNRLRRAVTFATLSCMDDASGLGRPQQDDDQHPSHFDSPPSWRTTFRSWRSAIGKTNQTLLRKRISRRQESSGAHRRPMVRGPGRAAKVDRRSAAVANATRRTEPVTAGRDRHCHAKKKLTLQRRTRPALAGHSRPRPRRKM